MEDHVVNTWEWEWGRNRRVTVLHELHHTSLPKDLTWLYGQ